MYKGLEKFMNRCLRKITSSQQTDPDCVIMCKDDLWWWWRIILYGVFLGGFFLVGGLFCFVFLNGNNSFFRVSSEVQVVMCAHKHFFNGTSRNEFHLFMLVISRMSSSLQTNTTLMCYVWLKRAIIFPKRAQRLKETLENTGILHEKTFMLNINTVWNPVLISSS